MAQYILAVDAGTTGITAVVLDPAGRMVHRAYSEFPQYFPHAGWVEQDAEEIYETALKVMKEAIAPYPAEDIKGLGITNQRETTILWDKHTGKPIHRAIVWQCRRTKEICQGLQLHRKTFHQKTGLLLDAYFSGTKIKWILDQNPQWRERASRGEILLWNRGYLAFMEIDSGAFS
jgi:glycerol kinase